MFVRMELGAGVDQEETILTDPESEEVDETFYMNRLLMLGAADPLSASPHNNPCSSHDSGISPQIDVLPGGAQRRPSKNKQINDNPLTYSARRGAVKDDKKSTKVKHMTETVTCRTSVPKSAQTPTTRYLYCGQDAAALNWSLRPLIQNHVGKQERGKSKVVKDKHSKSRPKCMDTTIKEGRLKPKTVLSILSRACQQRPGAELHTSLGFHGIGIKNPKTVKVPRVHRIHRRNWFGETLLHIAAVKGDVQSVNDMIKLGACVNLTDNAGWTPLHEAVWHKHYTIVETLLKAGAQVNPLGYKGVTPLHDAVKLGCLKTIDLLLKHGADPLLKNGSEEAAVDITEDMSVQELLRRYLPTASEKCLSAQSVSCTTSCGENGDEEPCRRARHSADKDEAENSEQSSEIEACVGPDAGSAEKESDPTKTGGSPKAENDLISYLSELPKAVSSVQTVVPLRDQAEDSSMCGFTMVQNRETLGSDTSPCRNSDAESDVTVDYIEPNSSPGHWFLSATQDFSGSTFRLVAETVRDDVCIVDGNLHVSQSLLSADNKGNPSQCKGSSRDSSNNTIKRVLDGSRGDHETVARKKIRRITVSSKPNKFLEYLLNFDLNSVSLLNNGSGTITKRGSGGCASRLDRNVCNYHSDPAVFHKEGLCEDACASHTQSHSNGECRISLLPPCINGIIESNSEGQSVLDNKTPLVTAVTHSSVPREGSPESSDTDSSSLLMNIIHDHRLTTSPEPQVGEKVLKISGDHLKVTHSSSQASIKPVTVQSCFDEDLQKSLPILNVANEAITTNITSIANVSEDNSNLTSRKMQESSEETVVSAVLSVDQEREAKLSCRQAYVSPTETDGIVNNEMQLGGRSGLKLAENSGFFEFPVSSACKKKEFLASTPSSKSPRDDRVDTNDSQNTLTEVSVLSPALACVTGDNEDDTRCSADSDCTFIDELEHLKTSKNAMDVIIHTNLNASPCDREKCAKQHGLYKALDEQSIAEQIDNATHPLDTETSVTMLRCLAQKPLCLLPAQENNQQKESAEDDRLQIAVENEELIYSNKPRKHKIKARRRKFQKQRSKVDTVTKHTVKITQKMLRHRNAVGETYLHWACKKGDMLAVKRLIEAGIDINVSDNTGWTALHEAVLTGYVDVVKQLLREGADVNRVGLSGVTPLHVAVSSGQYEVVKLLLQYGSNPHEKNVLGKCALDLADCQNIKRLLLSFKVPLVLPRDPNQPSMQGSEHLTFEKIQQDRNFCKSQASVLFPEDDTKRHARGTPRSGVNYKDNYFQQRLKEVEQKQIEMAFWEMREPEDGDRFADALSEIQTVLNVISKQQAQMFHLSKRTSPDLFHEDNSNKLLLELASQQNHLRTLLQKQNELQHKLKMYREQHYSHISSIGISESVSSSLARTALLSERAATTDDSMTLGKLIRKEVIQPGENALELAQMMKDTSKSLQNCSLTCGANAGNEPTHLQKHASKPSCTGFPFKESLTKGIFVGICSIHLIRDEEFLPCYMMARYWDLFTQSEEWEDL